MPGFQHLTDKSTWTGPSPSPLQQVGAMLCCRRECSCPHIGLKRCSQPSCAHPSALVRLHPLGMEQSQRIPPSPMLSSVLWCPKVQHFLPYTAQGFAFKGKIVLPLRLRLKEEKDPPRNWLLCLQGSFLWQLGCCLSSV